MGPVPVPSTGRSTDWDPSTPVYGPVSATTTPASTFSATSLTGGPRRSTAVTTTTVTTATRLSSTSRTPRGRAPTSGGGP